MNDITECEITFKEFQFKKKVMSHYDFDYTPSDYKIQSKESHYSSIGKFIVKFALIEDAVTHWYIPMMLPKSLDLEHIGSTVGHSVVAKMSAINKFNLYVDLCMAMNVDDRFDRFHISQEQFSQLRKMLVMAAEARNVIAHANWTETNDGVYYITDYVLNKQTGLYDFKLYDLTEDEILSGADFCQFLSDEIGYVMGFYK